MWRAALRHLAAMVVIVAAIEIATARLDLPDPVWFVVAMAVGWGVSRFVKWSLRK